MQENGLLGLLSQLVGPCVFKHTFGAQVPGPGLRGNGRHKHQLHVRLDGGGCQEHLPGVRLHGRAEGRGWARRP